MYNQLLYLVLGIRLLGSEYENNISITERLLYIFAGRLPPCIHAQLQTAETIKVQFLRHLAHQCRSIVLSGMSFESAIRVLSQSFPGIHSHCAVIWKLACTSLEEHGATQLLQGWSNNNDVSGSTFRETFYHHSNQSAAKNFIPMQLLSDHSSSTGSFLTPVATEDTWLGLIAASIAATSIFSQVIYFVAMVTESLTSGLTFAQRKLLKSKKTLLLPECPDSQIFYGVEFSDEQDMVEAARLKNVSQEKGRKKFLASVPQFLDHKRHASNCGAFEPYRVEFRHLTLWIKIVFLSGVPKLIDVPAH